MVKDAELNKITLLSYEQKKDKLFQWLRNDDDSIFKGLDLKDIFLFAMAVGFKKGARIPLSDRKPSIRLAYLDEQDEWLLKLVAIKTNEHLDILSNPKEIVNIAEEYANGGINHLQTNINNELGDYGKKLHEDLHDILNSEKSEINNLGDAVPENNVGTEKILSVTDYLKKGESERLEYKSSLRWDLIQKIINKDLEKVIVKSVAGFLNTSGGTLLIGVDDDGNILGIEQDLKLLKKNNSDSFYQLLINLVTDRLGLEFVQYIHIDFEKVNGKLVCLVLIKDSPKPVFVKNQNDREFYIRAGPTTRPMNNEESFNYINSHW